ncbi:unnamed protein product [Parascedosporium putredinis]|uniref:SH3 domain-containing protein n=1 Tax=Parascedosporium putredinis TaxID=1442378 RepID=A0A9P1H7V4_9PEZI|nr:unnamed protein product [Parascedosporium putredinis]CAI7998811.1 unnamed protein product [Parascedosporium putredinis]
MLSAVPTVSGQCISLKDSSACRAWSDASVALTSDVVGTFSFLQYVTDTQSFDSAMESYLKTTFITEKYQTQFGCGAVDFTKASDMYARYTKTTICSSIVQMSKNTCGLSTDISRPACSDTCADFAQSEAFISSNPNMCPTPGPNVVKLIRADLTVCALPEDALNPSRCVPGVVNEPENCGFSDSTIGLCAYCATTGLNATDGCCFGSNVEERCAGVELPSILPTMTFAVPSASAVPDDDDDDDDGGLSGGAIAGIVVGAVVGALLLAGLVYLCLVLARRRRNYGSQSGGSIFNQPSPARKGPPMSETKLQSPAMPRGYEMLPGGRIARMSALEGHSGDSPSHTRLSSAAGVAAVGGISGRMSSRRRNGSLSSNSMLDEAQSPTSAGGMSSPRGLNSQQSEQLPFFKDYYSQDDIHPGDRVAVLWAYQPRAADEFALERGDMLKVVGIWDDGWATGILLDDRADEWEVRRQAQRDSGVSNTSGRRDTSPPVSGEIKAFPLVCVCLPEHWRKTIDGEGSTETGSSHQRTISAIS